MKRQFTSLLGALGLALILLGMPALLIATHNAAPPRFGWSPEGLWHALTTPDDGTLLVTLAKIVGWIAWAILAFAILLELSGRLRHVPVPRLRGLGLPQAIARSLVAAALGTALSISPIMPALAGPAIPTDTVGAPVHPTETTSDRDADERYVVRKGDTLSEIALDHLGDGHAPAYMRIFDASDDTIQPDGRRLTDPDLIYPGWELTIPDDDPPKKPRKATKVENAPAASPLPVATIESATPTPSPTPAAESHEPTPTETTDVVDPTPTADPGDVEDHETPGWMLAGLAGAGALLAGTLWLAVRRHRATQTRGRRPGRMIPLPPLSLAVVEKTIRYQGEPTSDLIERIHSVLQRLAARLHQDQQPVPTVVAVEVAADGGLTLRLAEPATLPAPFEADPDPRTWRLGAIFDLDTLGPLELDRETVWPALATVGQDDAGWRMLNLEALGLIALTGDPACAEDLARHWACELALLPWADMLRVDCHQLFDELVSFGPHGVTHHPDHQIIDSLIRDAVGTGECLVFEELATVEAARAAQVGDIWVPHILVTATPNAPRLDELIDLVASRPGKTATAVITITDRPTPGVIEIQLTADGLVHVPSLGWTLAAAGITRDEAAGCAAIMAAADTMGDAPVPDPAEVAAAWQENADAAGHLHADLTIPRGAAARPDASSLLPEPDKVYIAATANTAEDLAALAPVVPEKTTARVRSADLHLDEDLADWWADSVDRPRLTVLGPVRLRLGRQGAALKGIKRVPYYTEIVAYLATRPHGATTEELAEALGIALDRVRRDLTVVRSWLGTNPRTGIHHVPDAHDNPESDARAVGVYLVDGLLSDADLFRRLRLRGEASGAGGLNDLADALRLVTGVPYHQLRRRGGLWLTDNRDDNYLTVSIVDTAHLVTTHALAAGDIKRARAAAELAHAVAPNETTPLLDLAMIADRDGRAADAARIEREITDWRDGSGDGPPDISARTDTILRAHRWLKSGRVG